MTQIIQPVTKETIRFYRVKKNSVSHKKGDLRASFDDRVDCDCNSSIYFLDNECFLGVPEIYDVSYNGVPLLLRKDNKIYLNLNMIRMNHKKDYAQKQQEKLDAWWKEEIRRGNIIP